jgi:hypothetical protein
VAAKAVIGQQPAQVGMAGERDAEHVEHLALEPVGAGKDAGQGRHRLVLAQRRLQPQPLIPIHRQQMIDDIETLGPFGVVDRGDVDQGGKAADLVGLQQGHHADEVAGRDI